MYKINLIDSKHKLKTDSFSPPKRCYFKHNTALMIMPLQKCVSRVCYAPLMVSSNSLAALRWPFSVSVMAVDSRGEIIIYNGGVGWKCLV